MYNRRKKTHCNLTFSLFVVKSGVDEVPVDFSVELMEFRESEHNQVFLQHRDIAFWTPLTLLHDKFLLNSLSQSAEGTEAHFLSDLPV